MSWHFIQPEQHVIRGIVIMCVVMLHGFIYFSIPKDKHVHTSQRQTVRVFDAMVMTQPELNTRTLTPTPTETFTETPVSALQSTETEKVTQSVKQVRKQQKVPSPVQPHSISPVSESTTFQPELHSAHLPTDSTTLPSKQPAEKNYPPPPYPRHSQRLGEQGKLVLAIEVDTNGSVVQIHVQRSTGFERLDRSALDTVKKWRFIPGTHLGQPQKMWLTVPIQFVLH